VGHEVQANGLRASEASTGVELLGSQFLASGEDQRVGKNLGALSLATNPLHEDVVDTARLNRLPIPIFNIARR